MHEIARGDAHDDTTIPTLERGFRPLGTITARGSARGRPTHHSLPHPYPVLRIMNKRILIALMGLFLVSARASAQQKTVSGKVTSEQGTPLPGVSIVVKGTTVGALSTSDGNYSIRAAVGQVLQFRSIGTAPEERTVGDASVINVQLRRVATSLDAVVVTAMGQTASQRELGTAQQTVSGSDIAQTQRVNFVNALAGRVAGVDVTSTSGAPGASTSIVIRGVSSISSTNQPLIIVDGLPVDNKTTNTGNLASDAPTSALAFSNRNVDFTNRAADINPEDIESLTVLKGPEASALYGIDAANGAIVITTKRGRNGLGGFDYSNNFQITQVRAQPDIQDVYGPSGTLSISGSGYGSYLYFGPAYAPNTHHYNNISNFFQTGATQRHNLAFSGGAADNRLGYRISATSTKEVGVIPNTGLNKINLTGASQGQVNNWLSADLSMNYIYSNNDKAYKGDDSPLIGLLAWPDTNNAANWLTPAGTRARITGLTQAVEVDNPYFAVNKNKSNNKTNRVITNAGLTFSPFSWGYLKTNLGADAYTSSDLLLRHPESAMSGSSNGILDINDDVTRNINAQTLFQVNERAIAKGLSLSGMVGNAVLDQKSTTNGSEGTNFLDPNFVSINNAQKKSSRTVISQRRLVSAFGQATANFRNYLYITGTGRNDWTSTIPVGANSFFYPSISGSFIFTDAFPSLQKHMTGKLRAAWAEVGRDAPPYSYRTTLQGVTTTNGGYSYGFTGPNPNLRPEFAKSSEIGAELSFLNDRLGIDATIYHKTTENQIVQNLRESYATGFILFNLNGASTENKGAEISVRGTPIQHNNYSWDFLVNFAKARGKTVSLPNALPESYVSDTWLYGNVRNGTEPGLSTMSLTGLFYLRDTVKNSPAYGQTLIDPTTGLPLRSSTFIDHGYDRQPDFTIGLSNNIRVKRTTLSFLFDIRKGGDVFNATQHYLTIHGLATSTLDRNKPIVIPGVLRDGKEGSANPTQNTIAIVPALQTAYYTSMSEEPFIEKNINWLRLRDITLSYQIPDRIARNASAFVTATDVFLWTNYTGLDPIANGNDAAVGGSSGVGIDYGDFPIPRGINFGFKVSF
jgi:TonB-linked SusC/RagA family outer membrane protein